MSTPDISPSGFDLTPPSAEERKRLESSLSRAEADVLLHHGSGRQATHYVGDQGRQIDFFGVQRGVAAGETFALQQVGHQVAHQGQVAQQRVTAGLDRKSVV